jgi:hypothetical protein
MTDNNDFVNLMLVEEQIVEANVELLTPSLTSEERESISGEIEELQSVRDEIIERMNDR